MKYPTDPHQCVHFCADIIYTEDNFFGWGYFENCTCNGTVALVDKYFTELDQLADEIIIIPNLDPSVVYFLQPVNSTNESQEDAFERKEQFAPKQASDFSIIVKRNPNQILVTCREKREILEQPKPREFPVLAFN